MKINELQRSFFKGDSAAALPSPRQPGGEFKQTLFDLVNRVDDLQRVSSEQVQGFVAGEHDDIHEVMISMNQAQLSFQFMTEVRNRLLEGYQELMRMQV